MILNSADVERHNYDEIRPRAAGALAMWAADRMTELHQVLGRHLGWAEERQLTLRAVVVGLILTGAQDRDGEHAELRRALLSLPTDMQRELGVRDEFDNVISYAMVEKAINAISRVLSDAPVIVEHDHPVADEETGEIIRCPEECPFIAADENWFLGQFASRSIPDDLERSPDAALDWTDKPSWGRIHGASPDPDVEIQPGDEIVDSLASVIENAKSGGGGGWPRLHPNGRKLWTKDDDALIGHRNKDGLSDLYAGYELGIWSAVYSAAGKHYAAFISAVAISSAGTHPGQPTIAGLRNARHNGIRFDHLIVDPGYTMKSPELMHRPMRKFVDDLVLRVTTRQHKRYEDVAVRRKLKDGRRVTYRIKNLDGGFFSSATPDDFDHLPYPPHGADRSAGAKEILRLYEDRAAWAFTPHGRQRGVPRYAGPATKYGGYKVRCINWPESWRQDEAGRKTSTCKKGDVCSCGLVVTIPYAASSEKIRQTQLFAVPAWYKDWNRRTTVERGNGDIKGGITDLDRATIKCFGIAKNAIYIAGRVASFNLQIAIREYSRINSPDPWNLAELNQPEPEPAVTSKTQASKRKKRSGGGRPSGDENVLVEELDTELRNRKRLRLLARRKAATDRSRRERKEAQTSERRPRSKPPP